MAFSSLKPCPHVFIDFDGTLVDSIELLLRVMRRSLPNFDREKTIAALKSKTFASDLINLYGRENMKNITYAVSSRMSNNSYRKEGVEEGIRRLRHISQIHLVSAGEDGPTIARIHYQHLYRAFDTVHVGCSIDKAEIISAYCEGAKIDFPDRKKRCFMIGDAVPDLEAANRAGVTAIGISDVLYSPEELGKYGVVFANFTEAVDYIEGVISSDK